MKASLDMRALTIGAAALIVGYYVCVALLIAVATTGVSHSMPLFYALMAPFLLASGVSGFIGALFAREKPLLYGTLGAAVGCLVLALITLLGVRAMHAPGGLEQALPFLAMVAPAFCGTLVAVYIWPRRGL